jgi:hypothetical protein
VKLSDKISDIQVREALRRGATKPCVRQGLLGRGCMKPAEKKSERFPAVVAPGGRRDHDAGQPPERSKGISLRRRDDNPNRREMRERRKKLSVQDGTGTTCRGREKPVQGTCARQCVSASSAAQGHILGRKGRSRGRIKNGGNEMTAVLTPADPRWNTFTEALNEAGMKHGCRHDHRLAKSIMASMGNIDVPATIEFFERLGGYCDCEILLNVDP